MTDQRGAVQGALIPLHKELWVYFYYLSDSKTYAMTGCKAECNKIILSCHEYTTLLHISNMLKL